MTTTQLLLAFMVGTAALAIWSYVRWPGAAPGSLRGAVVRAAIALVLLQVGSALLGVGVEAAPGVAAAIGVLVLVVVPVLTYAFLASLWFLKACADLTR